MIQGFYSAAMGSKAQQRRLDTIADNVANVNTVGFKSTRMDFKDAMYSTMKKQVEGQDGNLELGHGVLTANTKKYYHTGSMKQTGEPLDMAIQGEGFFTVVSQGGELRYTRNGAFSVSEEAAGNFLVTGNGEYVMDTNGQRIDIPAGTKGEEITVTADGTLRINSNPVATMNIVTFDNMEGLEATGQTSFIATEVSGQPRRVGTEANVGQGILESSNVEMAKEISTLIRTQRAFQLAGKGITTADEMESIANNMRR